MLLPKQRSCAPLRMATRYGLSGTISTTERFSTVGDGWAPPFELGLSSPGRSDHRAREGAVARDLGAAPASAKSAAGAGSGVWHWHGGGQSLSPAGSGGAGRA